MNKIIIIKQQELTINEYHIQFLLLIDLISQIFTFNNFNTNQSIKQQVKQAMLSWSEKKQREEKTRKSQIYKRMLDEQIQVKNRLLRRNEPTIEYYEPGPMMRLNTQPIPRQYDIDEYENQIIRAQQSSFLPVINAKRVFDYYDSYTPYHQSPKLLHIRKPRPYIIPTISQDDDQRTEQYLQQCEDIINNLKILTSKSANKRLFKDRPKYYNIKNSRTRDRAQYSIDFDSRRQRNKKDTWQSMDRICHASQRDPQDLHIQLNSKQLSNNRNAGKIKSRNKTLQDQYSKPLKGNINQNSPSLSNKQQSEQAIKAAKSKRQKQRHDNIMKYLMQAKNRGKKLSEKILEYRSIKAKEKEQNKKVQQ